MVFQDAARDCHVQALPVAGLKVSPGNYRELIENLVYAYPGVVFEYEAHVFEFVDVHGQWATESGQRKAHAVIASSRDLGTCRFVHWNVSQARVHVGFILRLCGRYANCPSWTGLCIGSPNLLRLT